MNDLLHVQNRADAGMVRWPQQNAVTSVQAVSAVVAHNESVIDVGVNRRGVRGR